MSAAAFDMIVERLGVLEAQEAFEARRRRVTRGDALGLPFVIEHAHDNDDPYWDGSYRAPLFHVKLDFEDHEPAWSWHKQHMDVLSAEHAELLDDDQIVTAAEAGFTKSLHRDLHNHVVEMHLRKAIDGEVMSLRMASLTDDLHLLVRCKGERVHVDDILRSLCDVLRRPDVFGQSFAVRKATIVPALSGPYEILNAIHMDLRISETGKTRLVASIAKCLTSYPYPWGVIRYFTCKHMPQTFAGCIDELYDETSRLFAFVERMEKLRARNESL